MWEEDLKVARSIGNRSCLSVVEGVNKLYHTSVCVKTVRCRVKDGLAKVPPRYGSGKRSSFKPEVEEALKKAFSTYVQLGNAERNIIPDRPKMMSILKACLKNGDCPITRFDKLYDRFLKSVSDDVQVMSDNEKSRTTEIVTKNMLCQKRICLSSN